jgi:hypothetical protein
MPYTDDERARIMQESRDILTTPFEVTDDLTRAMSRPIPDELEIWRRDMQQIQDRRERAQNEIREVSLESRLKKYIDQSISNAVATMCREMNNAIVEERALLIEIIGKSMGEMNDLMLDEIEKSSPKVVPMRREVK